MSSHETPLTSGRYRSSGVTRESTISGLVREIVMICRRTGEGESKAQVEPPGGCIHSKHAQPEGLSFHLGALD
jgi:hypothetical protein